MKESFAFGEFAQSQIEEAGAMAINQHDAEAGKCSQQLSQGFQVEMAIHQKLRAGQLRRQIILAPETLRRASEDGLGMCAVAAQILREADDAIEIGAGRLIVFTMTMTMTILLLLLPAALASALQMSHGFAGQILGKDRLFLVGLVARRRGLKVEAESAGSRIFKFCEFVDLLPSNHSVIPVLSSKKWKGDLRGAGEPSLELPDEAGRFA